MPKFTVDLRFVFLERELWALGEYLKTIEPQVNRLIAEDEQGTREALEAQGYEWEDEEVQLGFQDLHTRVTTVIPRLLRNPFVVATWAAWESGIEQIANDLARAKKIPHLLAHETKGSFHARAKRYFATTLDIVLDPDPRRLSRLDDLRVLRNAIAHWNGEQRVFPPEKWKPIATVLSRTPSVTLDLGYIIATGQYLNEAFADVDQSIRGIIMRERGPALKRLT